ncbi:MAG: hypothetical protein IPJ10_02525 [Flavobacteriales bacterium]|nr:hypothetical protein [Flavobacteriales bacterium]
MDLYFVIPLHCVVPGLCRNTDTLYVLRDTRQERRTDPVVVRIQLDL